MKPLMHYVRRGRLSCGCKDMRLGDAVCFEGYRDSEDIVPTCLCCIAFAYRVKGVWWEPWTQSP